MAGAHEFERRILNCQPGIVYVYDLVERRNLYANVRWFEDFGYSIDETQQAGDKLLVSLIHPDDLPRVAAHHAALAAAIDDTEHVIAYRIRRSNGVYAWLESRDCPFARGPDGRVTQIVGFAQDVSAQKQIEASFRNEADLRRAVIENAVEGICVCEEIPEPPGIFFSVWNQRMTEISGYTLDEINRLGWYQTVYTDPETQARAADRMNRMRRGENLETEEWTITRKDGARRNLLISTRVIVDAAGAARVLAVMHDVTDRLRLERRLRDGERLEAIGRLAGGVAHDFNNLLTTILGGAALLEDSARLDPAEKAVAQEILGAAKRGAELTRQLLMFGRRQRAATRPTDLGAHVEQTLRMVTRLLGAEVVVDASLARGCVVDADPAMLDQMILNLAVNARDAMPNGGRLGISVSTETAGDSSKYVLLRVTDTGVGISEDALPHIFEPFFTTKPEGAGTGLGLAIVHGVVAQHGGKITVESSPGKGTAFEVRLPWIDSAADEPARASGPRAVRPLCILLVEDQDPVRRVTRRLLQRMGHRVIEAAGFHDAQRMAREHAADLSLLLTDVSLGPGPKGPDLALAIREVLPNLPVIFMSGFDDVLSSHPLVEGHDFLQKPFTGAELAGILQRRLGG
jgi:PAS domain S-box-containing protein